MEQSVMVPGFAPVASESRTFANRLARRRRLKRQQTATAEALALHDAVSFVDPGSDEPGTVFKQVNGSRRSDRARVLSLTCVMQERVMSKASADRAARRVSRVSTVSDVFLSVFLSVASQADVPGPAEGDPGLNAETQQRVAVFDGVMLVPDQAGGLLFVPRAVVPVMGMHDRLVFLAEAPSAEDVLRAWSLVASFEAPDADAILIAQLLPHRPAEVSEFRALLCVMCVAVADSAHPHRISRHPIVTHFYHSNDTEISQRYLT